jgi:hypothetical protein
LIRAGFGLWLGCSLTPLPGPPLLPLGDPLAGVADGVLVLPGVELLRGVELLDGVFVFGLLFGVDGVFGLVPEAANATAGATEMITGTLQPAFSNVLLETRNERSLPREDPSSALYAGSSTLTSEFLPPRLSTK